MSLPPNMSIHGVKAYIDFVNPIDFSTMQAFIPVIYITPTVGVMIAILFMYHKAKKTLNRTVMDPNVFVLIMFYFLFNSLFFIGDYLHLNLPSSGIITSWCAGIQPSRYVAILIILTYSSNFGTILVPFWICVIRLVILFSPRNNDRYCQNIMRYIAIPSLFIIPLLLTFFNYSVTGYCKQMGSPFTFGSLIIYEGDWYAQWNVYIHFAFSIIVFIGIAVLSVIMNYKLRVTVFNGASARTKALKKRAERSLTLMEMSCIVPFITNSIISLCFIFSRQHVYMVLFLRPIGNDYETVMMPWVLFLTHPLFHKKRIGVKISSNTPSNNVFQVATPRVLN